VASGRRGECVSYHALHGWVLIPGKPASAKEPVSRSEVSHVQVPTGVNYVMRRPRRGYRFRYRIAKGTWTPRVRRVHHRSLARVVLVAVAVVAKLPVPGSLAKTLAASVLGLFGCPVRCRQPRRRFGGEGDFVVCRCAWLFCVFACYSSFRLSHCSRETLYVFLAADLASTLVDLASMPTNALLYLTYCTERGVVVGE
jgi:hypothetical protein